MNINGAFSHRNNQSPTITCTYKDCPCSYHYRMQLAQDVNYQELSHPCASHDLWSIDLTYCPHVSYQLYFDLFIIVQQYNESLYCMRYSVVWILTDRYQIGTVVIIIVDRATAVFYLIELNLLT